MCNYVTCIAEATIGDHCPPSCFFFRVVVCVCVILSYSAIPPKLLVGKQTNLHIWSWAHAIFFFFITLISGVSHNQTGNFNVVERGVQISYSQLLIDHSFFLQDVTYSFTCYLFYNHTNVKNWCYWFPVPNKDI